MKSISEIIYQAAGSPEVDGDCKGRCRTCGSLGEGIAFVDWVKDGFTNHDLLGAGEIVCRACLFCFDDKSAALQKKTGREKPQKMRTYSHFVIDGDWHPLTKGEKRKMRELLGDNPEVVVISEAGQKHLIFRARVGWWQFEEHAMPACWPKVEAMLGPIEELLNGGFSKNEISSGDYNLYRIDKFGVYRWHELAQLLTGHSRSVQFQLALFLAQKDVS